MRNNEDYYVNFLDNTLNKEILVKSTERYEERYMTMSGVCSLTGMNSYEVKKLFMARLFPVPLRIGRKALWPKEEVFSWVRNHSVAEQPDSCSHATTTDASQNQSPSSHD